MTIHFHAPGESIKCPAAPGERMLLAGLRGGIALPYECATGTCGTCRARLLSGEVRDLWSDAPGKAKAKRDRGELLMCQCTAQGEVALELAKRPRRIIAPACVPDLRTGVLSRTARLTHDVMAFDVELDEPVDFEAGQFMLLAAPSVPGYRAYSMCNYQLGAARLEFVVKRKPGGAFSDWLFDADREGARLEAFGPLGAATFDPSVPRSILCIAGGSGIAGMMAILACARERSYFAAQPGHVFFGVRTLRDAFFLEELTAAARSAPLLGVTIALSDEPVPPSAARDWPALAFTQGFVHEAAKRAMSGKYTNLRAYVAGPPPAVDAAMRLLLLEARLPATEIRYDKFS
jgi:toluene monooxygenase electron transfer component